MDDEIKSEKYLLRLSSMISKVQKHEMENYGRLIKYETILALYPTNEKTLTQYKVLCITLNL